MRAATWGIAAALMAASTLAAATRPGPQAPAPVQGPTFRAGTEFVRLDVGVLDKNRRPISGLSASDFVLLEDGKAQPITTFSETRLPGPAAAPASGNDGRIIVILIDDLVMPADPATLNSARAIGRGIVERLSPNDRAAVQFVRDNAHAVALTNDKAALTAAMDAISVGTQDAIVGPDVMFSARTWVTAESSVRALEDTLDTLRAVPEQRKTVFYVSVGTPAGSLDRLYDRWDHSASDAQTALVQTLQATFQGAMWANVNVYAIDPAGLNGYEAYLTNRATGKQVADYATYIHQSAQANLDYLRVVSDQTGGHAVINTNDFRRGLDEIFTETSDYYLLGYRPAGNLADKKYRRIQVKVDKPGVTIQSRRGFFAVAK